MSAHCCHPDDDNKPTVKPEENGRRMTALWIVLGINASMFVVEIGAGALSGSAALQADSLDFLGDAANYAVSLFVLGMAVSARAWAAIGKAASMLVIGLWVLGTAVSHLISGSVPDAPTMGIVGALALVANLASFGVLWQFRGGDSNMRSAWICTRNDVVGNTAVLLAALGVFGTGAGWPDVIVASIMAVLAIQGAATVLPQAVAEFRSGRSATA